MGNGDGAENSPMAENGAGMGRDFGDGDREGIPRPHPARIDTPTTSQHGRPSPVTYMSQLQFSLEFHPDSDKGWKQVRRPIRGLRPSLIRPNVGQTYLINKSGSGFCKSLLT
ncbi:hypothetical protein PIB30_076046 [Stylosanthes scabra]|uniref:Uncharacterized protein n=1 Tax=Stylosanthes scabra TaxID=79078 RepID=A0ABU6XN36_9FABA|nr:hypothetical protein [Stylosanthes scabra]